MDNDINVVTLSLAKEYTDTHGGGGGTSDYNALSNQPQINGITLKGNKSLSDLGINAEIEQNILII